MLGLVHASGLPSRHMSSSRSKIKQCQRMAYLFDDPVFCWKLCAIREAAHSPRTDGCSVLGFRSQIRTHGSKHPWDLWARSGHKLGSVVAPMVRAMVVEHMK